MTVRLRAARPPLRKPWRAGRQGAYSAITVADAHQLLCPAWVKRTVGAGAGRRASWPGRWRHAAGKRRPSFWGPARSVLVPTGRRQQVPQPGSNPRWTRLLVVGLGCVLAAACTGPTAREATATSRGAGGAGPAGLLAHGRLADRCPRRAGHGPGGPGRPGHHGPRPATPRCAVCSWCAMATWWYERYWQGVGASDGHDGLSVTKSFISALVGIALGDGQPPGPGPDRRGAASRPSPRRRRPAAAPGHRQAAVGHDLGLAGDDSSLGGDDPPWDRMLAEPRLGPPHPRPAAGNHAGH